MVKTSFASRVYAAVRRIPKGHTRTYAQVARLAGSPKAFRAVGRALAANRDMRIPCHRVIRSDGKLGGYNGLRGDKGNVLKQEGCNDKKIHA